MSRTLLVDVGAGTMDVLWHDDESDLHYKAVVRSPVRELADRVRKTTGNLIVTGREMGGGPISSALAERAGSHRVVMTRSSAATIHHNPDKVRARSIEIIEDDQADRFVSKDTFTEVRLADIDPDRLRNIVEGFGVSFQFDAVGVCLQDHGRPPEGVSHLDYRNRLFSERLGAEPHPRHLLFAADEVPETFNRLRSAATDASNLPAEKVYVLDSGMAAILGATLDPRCNAADRILVLDVATSHTVGGAFDSDRLCGFFEYHTRDITVERIDTLLKDLAEGKISHRRILDEGGHGAWLGRSLGFDKVQLIIATGPRRSLLEGSTLPLKPGAPMGDNMMTGTAGLLAAIRHRTGQKSR